MVSGLRAPLERLNPLCRPKPSPPLWMTQRPSEITAPNDNERGSGVNAALQIAHRELDAAVDGSRRAGQRWFLPRSLLTRAWPRFLTGARAGPRERADRPWRSLGNRRAWPHETVPGRHPPPPRPPLWKAEGRRQNVGVSETIVARRSRRRRQIAASMNALFSPSGTHGLMSNHFSSGGRDGKASSGGYRAGCVSAFSFKPVIPGSETIVQCASGLYDFIAVAILAVFSPRLR